MKNLSRNVHSALDTIVREMQTQEPMPPTEVNIKRDARGNILVSYKVRHYLRFDEQDEAYPSKA